MIDTCNSETKIKLSQSLDRTLRTVYSLVSQYYCGEPRSWKKDNEDGGDDEFDGLVENSILPR